MAGTAAIDNESRRLLRGAIDLHMHTAPDVFPRSVTTYEAAVQARDAGMRAILVKSHTVDTAARAELVSDLTDFPVYGGVALNYAQGGLNWHAVRESSWQGGREVWMPTLSARKFFEHGREVPTLFKRVPIDIESGIVITENGELLEEVRRIVDLIGETGAILATGHVSPEEGLILLRYAHERGLTRLLVTHPHADFVGWSVEQMREAAALGAVMEMHYAFVTEAVDHPVRMDELMAVIREVGPEHCVLATDGGQKTNPPPVEMLRLFMAGAIEADFSEDEIRMMNSATPARLLGLEA